MAKVNAVEGNFCDVRFWPVEGLSVSVERVADRRVTLRVIANVRAGRDGKREETPTDQQAEGVAHGEETERDDRPGQDRDG